MPRTRCFVYVDGREVQAATGLAFFDHLRRGERHAPPELGSYLELLRHRARIFHGVDFDIGPPGLELSIRCQRALESLMSHGWVRVKPERRSANGPRLLLG